MKYNREVVLSFLGLYPENSTNIDLDIPPEIVKDAAEKVATETIFTEDGKRFYDYIRGRHDETLGDKPILPRITPKNHEEISKFIRESFEDEDLLQLYFTFHIHSWIAELYYNELLDILDGKKSESTGKLMEVYELLFDQNRPDFSQEVYEGLLEMPRFEEIFQWLLGIRRTFRKAKKFKESQRKSRRYLDVVKRK